VIAEPLSRAAGRLGRRRLDRDARQHGRQIGDALGPQRFEPARMDRRDVVIERVDHRGKRHFALVLSAHTVQHAHTGLCSELARGAEQSALADSRLTSHDDRALSAAADCGDGHSDPLQFGVAAYESAFGFSK
jgi:hypothetical protein